MMAKDGSTLLTPLELQPAEPPHQAELYELDELVRYHDRTFVNYAYTALARRAPTPEEFAQELDDLRSGRRDKVQIIEGLLNRGADGKTTPRVVGLRRQILRHASNWPIIGYLWRLLRGLTSLPLQVKHQQQFEAYLLGQQQKIADYVNGAIAPAIADSIDAVLMLSDSLQRHALTSEEALSSIVAEQKQVENRIEAKISTQKSELEEQMAAQHNQLEASLKAERARIDAQRDEFEQRLKAQQELIVQEQQVIVETQKVVTQQMRAEIRELASAYEQQNAELLGHLQRLQGTVDVAESAALPSKHK